MTFRWAQDKCSCEVAIAQWSGVWFWGYDNKINGMVEGCGGTCSGVSRNKGYACAGPSEALLEALNFSSDYFFSNPRGRKFSKVIQNEIKRLEACKQLPTPMPPTTKPPKSVTISAPGSANTPIDSSCRLTGSPTPNPTPETTVGIGTAVDGFTASTSLDVQRNLDCSSPAPSFLPNQPKTYAPVQPIDFDALAAATPPVPMLSPEAQAAKRISEAYLDALNSADSAIRKAVACGLLLYEQQQACKRSSFPDWMAKHCPEIPKTTAYRWIDLAKDSCAALGVSAQGQNQFSHRGKAIDIPLSTLLITPIADLSPAAQAVQTDFFRFLDGKSQKQIAFNMVSQQPKGGDKVWGAWLQSRHPELCVDGVPDRSKCAKVIREEFAAHQAAQFDPNTKARLEFETAEELLTILTNQVLAVQDKQIALATKATRALLHQACTRLKQRLQKADPALK
jgi:hypothetical protein